MDNSLPNQNSSSNSIPWDKFIEFVKSNNVDQAASIPEETYQFAADPKNHDFLFTSALGSLKGTNSDDYKFERAEALVGMMQIFARMMVKELEIERNKIK
jgi:hypothetical protein